MLDKHSTRAQEMFQYMRDISKSANGWFNYDGQLRLRKVSDPHSSWGLKRRALIHPNHYINNFSIQENPKTTIPNSLPPQKNKIKIKPL